MKTRPVWHSLLRCSGIAVLIISRFDDHPWIDFHFYRTDMDLQIIGSGNLTVDDIENSDARIVVATSAYWNKENLYL